MKKICIAVIASLCLFLGSPDVSFAAKRVALVIGNSAYENAPALKNPINDANAMAELLQRLGFDVVKGVDLNHKGFARTITQFARKMDAGVDVGLFFYAGHGLQVHGRNYLVPIDAKLDSEASLNFEAVPLSNIIALMERSQNTNLIFLDACRDNPLARNLARSMGTRSTSIGRGLASVKGGLETLISFSTQPGNVALDGSGQNSPFAKALLKHSDEPGLEVEVLMRKVRQDVYKETNGEQVPWSESSLTRAFVFQPVVKVAAKPAGDAVTDRKADPGTVLPVLKPQFDTRALDLAFWNSIQGSRNIPLFEEYLVRFPKGQFAVIAKARIARLHAEQKASQTAARKAAEDAAEKAAAEKAAAEKAAAQRAAAEKAAVERVAAEKAANDAARKSDATAEMDTPNPAASKGGAKSVAPGKTGQATKTAARHDADGNPTTATAAKPAVDAGPSIYDLTVELQKQLKRVGCDPGAIDGKWGPKGRNALAEFAEFARLSAIPRVPSLRVIEAVRARKSRVCQHTCRDGNTLKRGRCVATDVVNSSRNEPQDSGSYDGNYKITASRTAQYRKVACLDSYNLTLVVRDGRATHKLPFGHTLRARAQGGRLYITSGNSADQGHWSGALGLSKRPGARTSGYLKWGGDDKVCDFRLAVRRN